MRRRRDDLGNYIAGAQDDHFIAWPDILANQVFFVVERRVLHNDTTKIDRRKNRKRVQVAELTDAPFDLFELSQFGRRRELPCDCPARVAAYDPEPTLLLCIVDLDNNAIDLEVERTAALLPLKAALDRLLLAVESLDVVIDREAPLPQPLERLPLRIEADPFAGANAVGPER
ncbi:unannotated protein [freshwater metagenome]|uniref:Unannotated protein n=1 Tax=freshwater metagenome TaxID=449393 RepID=A0A6J6A060_9ZZZZ